MDNTILKVRNLKKYFKVDSKNTLKAVDNVSFDVYKNEILGVVGESGCGKTTLGRTILGLYKPTDGEIIFDGKDINKFNKKEMLDFKKRAQMIFQDPYASLNPRMTVKDIIAEGLEVQYPKMSNEEKDEYYRLLNIYNSHPIVSNYNALKKDIEELKLEVKNLIKL